MAESRPNSRVTKKDQAEKEFQLAFLRVAQGYGLAKHGFTCLAAVGVAGLVYLSIKELAGKTTIAEAALNFAAGVRVSEWAAWLAAAIMGVGWYRSQKSKKALRTTSLPRLKQLESALDPGRTSSGLDEEGRSPKGDVT